MLKPGCSTRTIAGLLVVAHAVALRAEDDWTDPLEDVGHDGVLLRHLANALFGLVGIDWLGQPAARPKARPPIERGEPALDAAIARMLTKPAGTAPSESAVLPSDDSADPQLVALVHQWQEAERAFAESKLPDDEREPLMDESCRLQRAVYAFPSRTLADLCAKLPAFRDEAEASDEAPRPDGQGPTLEACALHGLVADLERLFETTTVHPAGSDPVYAAIENHSDFLDRLDKGPPGRSDEEMSAAYDAWSIAFDAMGTAPPATSAGLNALARHLRWYLAYSEEEADGPPKWVLDVILGVAERFGTAAADGAPASDNPDPIFAAIAQSRLERRLLDIACTAPNADTEEWKSRVDAACGASRRAWRSLLAMTPTTLAGAQALARHAIDHIENHGCWSGENNEEDARALFRAIAAPGPWHDRMPTTGMRPMPGGGTGEDKREPDPAIADAAELARLDAAIRTLIDGEDRDAVDVPGYLELERQRNAVIERLSENPARTYEGLIAKGKALRSFESDFGTEYEAVGAIAVSLAEDIERQGTLCEFGLAPYAPRPEASAPIPMAAE